jgi:hypothetical protein
LTVTQVAPVTQGVPGTKFLDKFLSNGAGTLFVPGDLPLRAPLCAFVVKFLRYGNAGVPGTKFLDKFLSEK